MPIQICCGKLEGCSASLRHLPEKVVEILFDFLIRKSALPFRSEVGIQTMNISIVSAQAFRAIPPVAFAGGFRG